MLTNRLSMVVVVLAVALTVWPFPLASGKEPSDGLSQVRGNGEPTFQERESRFNLSELIEFALKHSPILARSAKGVEKEGYGIDAARADRMPRLDFTSGVIRYRYPTPVTPISGFPVPGPDGRISTSGLPKFDETLFDLGVVFRLPLYRGGRLQRAVHIAEMSKALAEDTLGVTLQELLFNLTSVYYKISQLEKVVESNRGAVRQLQAHRKNVEDFLQAGTAPQLDLLKTEVELAHAQQNLLLVENNLESAYELLKTLMGMEESERKISIVHETALLPLPPMRQRRGANGALDEALERALGRRPEYQAALRRLGISEERIKSVKGKRLPEVSLYGEFSERAGGEDFAYKDNWNVALRLTVPIYEGGSIGAEMNKERKEMEKLKEEERELRLNIRREIKDAFLAVENAEKRMGVTEKSIASARENLRVEVLKYETGAGTSTDVIDAQTLLLRAETDYYQGLYDRNTAVTSLKKALGEDLYGVEASR